MAIGPGKARLAGGGVLLRTGPPAVSQAGDDGSYGKGAAFNYTDHGDGTITDNATSLMWARDGHQAGCDFGNQTDWSHAITWAENLSLAGHCY